MDHKTQVIADVQRAIDGMNNIVMSLQCDAPLSSDIIAITYPRSTVAQFLGFSETVVEVCSLNSVGRVARSLTRLWGAESSVRLADSLELARKDQRQYLP